MELKKTHKHRRRRFTQFLLAFFAALVVGGAAITNVVRTGYADDVSGFSALGLGQMSATYNKGDGSSSCTGSAGTLNVSATGAKGTCSNTAGSITVTLANNFSGSVYLSFNYTVNVNEGTIKLNGSAKSANGSERATLPKNGTYTISVTTKAGAYTSSVSLASVTTEVVPTPVTTSFLAPEEGTYTVSSSTNGTFTMTPESTQTSKSQLSTEVYSLSATAPANLEFAAWYVNGSLASTANPWDSFTNGADGTTVKPMFKIKGGAMYKVNSTPYNDLHKAIAAAGSSGTIIVDQNGNVPSGSYTIPNGVTLLVPFDTANTAYTTEPEVIYGSHTNPSAFRTLTLLDGALITVASGGKICIPSKLSATGAGKTSWNGTPTGPHGKIIMASGSSITLQGGAALYCYGYIVDFSTSSGGQINAQSGSTVYETFQIRNWRGGGVTSQAVSDKKCFPINQYYVQNIESNLVLSYGAVEKLYTSVNANSEAYPTSVDFIGTTNGMFRMGAGSSVSKKYDRTLDRLEIIVSGSVSVANMSVSVSVASMDSKDYKLPIASNITITVLDGGIVNINSQSLSLLPESRIVVNTGGTVNISAPVYVYSAADWTGYVVSAENKDETKLVNVGYSPSGATLRTSILNNASIQNDGTININSGGALFTSSAQSDSSITGGPNKTGIVKFNVKSTDNGTDQQIATGYKTGLISYSVSYDTINFSSCRLKNGDGSYTPTLGSTAGTTWYYCGTCDASGVWETEHTAVPEKYTVTWKNDDGTILETDAEVEAGTVPTFDGATPTKASTAQYTFTFAGWTPTVAAIVGDTTYTATYTQEVNEYAITFVDEDGTTLDTQMVAYGITPTYGGATPSKEGDAQYSSYTFVGWDPELAPVTGEATYTATYEHGYIQTYTITWKNADGTVLETDENVAYGTTPSFNGETPAKAADAQYTYAFNGWSPEVTAVTGDATYTATYTYTVNQYTVTWKNADGTVLETDENVLYGTTPTYNGETPAKAADAQYTYAFNGWSPEVTAVTGDATYTATYTYTVNQYTVIFYDEDGTTVLGSTSIAYGEVPTCQNPTKEADGRTHYEFLGWRNGNEFYEKDTNLPVVTGEVSYVAEYRSYVNGIYSEDGVSIFYDKNGNPLPSYIWGSVVQYAGTDYDAPDGNYYFIDSNGVVVEYAGLVYNRANGFWYYFGENNYAYVGGRYYCDMSHKSGEAAASSIGNDFVSGWYTFDSSGKMVSGAPSSIDEDGVAKNPLGICNGYGLFTLSDGAGHTYYYYATEDGTIASDGTFYVERTNGLKYNGEDVEAGLYYFDGSGRLCTIVNGELVPMEVTA